MGLDSIFTPIPSPELDGLVTRSELWPSIFLRQEKEYIASLVPHDDHYLDIERDKYCGDDSLEIVLARRNWTVADLNLHLHLPYALKKFSEFLYGPGLEDEFLAANGGHDQITYSMLRVKDQGLIRELWIRLEEGEETFAEVASSFGEGSESTHKGLFGPLAMGNIQPKELRNILRSLKVGEINPPFSIGDWFVLLRLEALQPARLDQQMRSHLLDVKLNELLNERVSLLMRGCVPDNLSFGT